MYKIGLYQGIYPIGGGLLGITLAQILLGEKDYPAMGNFFRKTWGIMPQAENSQSAYIYRVYISRRCYNLNEIFFTQELDLRESQGDRAACDYLKEIRRTSFLNQYGLMCKAEELAACYASGQGFPRLLIVDELAIYGRELARLLEKMAGMLVNAYTELSGKKTSDEQSRLVRAFYSSVDIRIYGKNETPLLLPEELGCRMTFKEEMSATRWRSFIRSVSSLVAHTEGIRNKSYYPLFCIQNECLKNFNGKPQSYPYHGNELNIYQDRQDGIRFTFCERSIGSVHEFLAIPLWSGLPREQAKLLLKDTAGILSKAGQGTEAVGFPHIVSILHSSLPGLLQVQFQMISFLMAVISFFDFAEKYGIDLSGENYYADFDRCAMNFGTLCEIEPEMRVFAAPENTTLRQELKNRLYQVFFNIYHDESNDEEPPSDDMEYLLRSTESYFAEISAHDGRAIYAMREMGLTFDALTRDTDIVPMKKYLSEKSIPGNEVNHIFSMLLLIEDGQISTNVQLNDGEVQLRLKAGECAKFIWPERLWQFLPALTALEIWSERSGFSPERKFREFGTYLEQQEPEQYYGLSQLFGDFLRAQYDCGDKVQDWHIDFSREANLPDIKQKRWLSYPWSGRPWSKDEERAYKARKQTYWQWKGECQGKVIEYLKRYVELYDY